jgi:hypothetical protein
MCHTPGARSAGYAGAARPVAPLVGVTMSLHKLSAGHGYDYPIRQAAALDATYWAGWIQPATLAVRLTQLHRFIDSDEAAATLHVRDGAPDARAAVGYALSTGRRTRRAPRAMIRPRPCATPSAEWHRWPWRWCATPPRTSVPPRRRRRLGHLAEPADGRSRSPDAMP